VNSALVLEGPSLRISSPKDEGVLQVSKWNKCQVLLDYDEMSTLLRELSPVHFCVVSEPVKKDDGVVSSDVFLDHYKSYIEALKEGRLADESVFRKFFSAAMTGSTDIMYAIAVGTDKYLIKPIKPIIQLQAHHFFYSKLDGKFHPMVLSTESVTWGVQFSYPQLYQDPKSHRIAKVANSSEFPNTSIFARLLKWLRHHTLPTPFAVQDERVNAPIRIGRNCFEWIERHPQLNAKGIQVIPYAH
jgi:hypothetical protein